MILISLFVIAVELDVRQERLPELVKDLTSRDGLVAEHAAASVWAHAMICFQRGDAFSRDARFSVRGR